jgi:hypothetical protein
MRGRGRGARRKRPFVFGAPLFVVVARPLSLTLPPLPPLRRPPFGIAAPPAALGAGAGDGGASNTVVLSNIEKHLEGLTLSMATLQRVHAVKEGVFSKVSSTAALEFTASTCMHQGGRIPLPASLSDFGTVTAEPFAWHGLTEPQASPFLRQLLRKWLNTGATTDVEVCFVNTEPLAKAPLVAESETARYTGVPDVVTLRTGLDKETQTTWPDSSTSWDWKQQTVFIGNRMKVAAQAILQVAAFARFSDDGKSSIPVFFTDMATGIRCWIMVEGVIYTFHQGGGPDLSLQDGIRLFRYFIAHNGRLAPRDSPVRAGSGGSAAGRGPFTPSPDRGGGGGHGSTGAGGGGGGSKGAGGGGGGGKGASPYRDVLMGKGRTTGGGGQDSTDNTSQSRKTSPGDPTWARDDEAVASRSWSKDDQQAVFEMEVAAAADVLRMCGLDVADAFNPD